MKFTQAGRTLSCHTGNPIPVTRKDEGPSKVMGADEKSVDSLQPACLTGELANCGGIFGHLVVQKGLCQLHMPTVALCDALEELTGICTRSYALAGTAWRFVYSKAIPCVQVVRCTSRLRVARSRHCKMQDSIEVQLVC